MTISKKLNKENIVAKNGEAESAKYNQARKHILAAIEVLGTSAKAGDTLAKETIANLGVVILDLTK